MKYDITIKSNTKSSYVVSEHSKISKKTIYEGKSTKIC